MDQLEGTFAMAGSFPDAIADAIGDANGNVVLCVAVGGGAYLELSELVGQLEKDCAALADVAIDGQVDLKMVAKPATPQTVKLQVASCDGAAVGEVELSADASGTDLLAALRKGFCADDDMAKAVVEQPAKREGKWLPISEAFGCAPLLAKAKSSLASVLVFLKPASPPTSIAQLRVRLPGGGALLPSPADVSTTTNGDGPRDHERVEAAPPGPATKS
eukprot:5527578-Prymnesium_polylepis.1